MAQRVNVTTAAKLTGRSEKTIRAWLAEDPCPLSVEWGQYRGGRQMGKPGAKGTVRKGRTRLLDVEELRALHVARGGTEWHDRFLPVPDVREMAQRLEAVEQQLAALRERAPWLFTSSDQDATGARSEGRQAAQGDGVPDSAPPPTVPRQRPLSATQGTRPHVTTGTRKPLPDGWIAITRFAKNHGTDDRSLKRSPKMPLGQHAPDGDLWYLHGRGQYPVAHAYTPEDQAAAIAAVHAWRATHADDYRDWHECTDPEYPNCPCHAASDAAAAGLQLLVNRSEPAEQ